MRLYLVRHPQTEDNKTGVYQNAHSAISATGKEQMEQLVKRLSVIPLDAIISSPHQRTQTTAEAIAQIKNLPIITSELIAEHRWPSTLAGLSKHDPEIKKIRAMIEAAWITDPEWRHSDEERFIDTRARAVEFLRILEESFVGTHNHVLAVSHARFLKLLCSVILHGHDVSAQVARGFFDKISLSNSGITVAEYSDDAWHIVTINDTLHLGDYHRQNL